LRLSESDRLKAQAFNPCVSNVTRTTPPIVIELQYRKNTMRISYPFVGSSWWFMKIRKKI
jgi:hypothetical protein